MKRLCVVSRDRHHKTWHDFITSHWTHCHYQVLPGSPTVTALLTFEPF